MIGCVPSTPIECCPSSSIMVQAVQAPDCFGLSALPKKSPTKTRGGPSGPDGPSRFQVDLGGMALAGGGAWHGQAPAWASADQLQRAWTVWTAWTIQRFQWLARCGAGTCVRTAWTGQDRQDSIIGFPPRSHPGHQTGSLPMKSTPLLPGSLRRNRNLARRTSRWSRPAHPHPQKDPKPSGSDPINS